MRHAKSDPVKIGPAVRIYRMSAGLTQAQLAEMVGVATETLSRIETGRMANVSMRLCSKLAAALGVGVPDLLVREKPVSRPSELRPAERAILAMTARLDDAAVNDLVHAVRLIVGVARQIAAASPPRRLLSPRDDPDRVG